jgi:hypothetical protein
VIWFDPWKSVSLFSVAVNVETTPVVPGVTLTAVAVLPDEYT